MASKQLKHTHPLAEVFGYKTTDRSVNARTGRTEKLCPFNNHIPLCTKDKKDRPLGVCSIYHSDAQTIICPVRFREDWKISKDAADFFFKPKTSWSYLKEVRLKTKSGESAGNIDLVIVSHDKDGSIKDFGAVEVQAVYVSGNLRNPFEAYMKDPEKNGNMDWTNENFFPGPDFLSSSRKRLAPQLIYKGQILQKWNKKQVVVVDRPFFETLPDFPTTDKFKSDLCWLIYDLKDNSKTGRFQLDLDRKVYTGFDEAMKTFTTPEAGDVSDFIATLERKLSKEMETLKKDHGVYSHSKLFEKLERDQNHPTRELDL